MTLEWAADRLDRQWLALVETARAACRQHPDSAGAVLALAEAQAECGQWRQARSTLAEARARLGDPPALVRLSARLGADGAGAADDAVTRLELAAQQALTSGNWATLAELCEHPVSHAAPAAVRFYGALANAQLGRPRGVDAAAIDPLRDAAVVELPPGPRWASLASFHAALLAELAELDELDNAHHAVATRHGHQTETFVPRAGSAAHDLFAAVRVAVKAFVVERRWLAPPAAMGALAISAWSVSYPAGADQTSHVHPDGWLSLVYGVAVPDDGSARLELGSLAGGPYAGLAAPWPIRPLALRPGELAIFPSWMPHAATAHHGSGQRVVIALDIVPRGGWDGHALG